MAEVSWDPSSSDDYEWTTRAHSLLEAGQLRTKVVQHAGVKMREASGECPRCGHDVAFRLTLTSLVADRLNKRRMFSRHLASDAASNDSVAANVECRCSEPHAGRPDKGRGCGLVFPVGEPQS